MLTGRKQKIAVLSVSRVATDGRVLRQLQTLSCAYEVTCLGFGPFPKNIPTVTFKQIPDATIARGRGLIGAAVRAIRLPLLLIAPADWGFFRLNPWARPILATALKELKEGFDLVLANNPETLPIALRLSKGSAPVICDLHEYKPEQVRSKRPTTWIHSLFWRRVLRRFLPEATQIWSVSKRILSIYASEHKVQGLLVPNAPKYEPDLQPGTVNAESIHVVHHGAADPRRGIETIIQGVLLSHERFHLHLMLVESPGGDYLKSLKTRFEGNPRISFLPPVSSTEISRAINQFDIGIHFLPPTNLNQAYALPNKILEFVQARLAIVVGPSPEMADLVHQYGIGKVSMGFTPKDVALTLNSLTPQEIMKNKLAANVAAETLSSNSAHSTMLESVSSCINHFSPASNSKKARDA